MEQEVRNRLYVQMPSDTHVKAVESKAAAKSERIEWWRRNISHYHCWINTRNWELQSCWFFKVGQMDIAVISLTVQTSWLTKSKKISQCYSKCEIVRFYCCSLTLKVKRSCKIPLTADLVPFPDAEKSTMCISFAELDKETWLLRTLYWDHN